MFLSAYGYANMQEGTVTNHDSACGFCIEFGV
jgi:hypothetical protein